MFQARTYLLALLVSGVAAFGQAKDELQTVRELHDRIQAHQAEKRSAYSTTIPNTTVSYSMAAIPAGDFVMGSPDSDPQRTPEEQPQHKVHIDAFWMQTHEVTWDEYRLFMFANQAGEASHKDSVVDAVSRPTRPYVEMSFGMGINGYPAISMTQHAANKYAEWLSAKTGEFYRLPTEAEWEFACRAGNSGSYHTGEGVRAMRLAGWCTYRGESGGARETRPVGQYLANAFGLYDMHGNVREWCLDWYFPKAQLEGALQNPNSAGERSTQRVLRGGCWATGAAACRSAARNKESPETAAPFTGFRVVMTIEAK